jgi:small-conductance mechanosensitive channel
MPQKAHITSVEALEIFRSQLIVYVSKARPTLEEVSAEVVRIRLWLQNEQRTHWEIQVRRRTKELEQTQAALFSARLSNLRKETAAEQMAFHRARRALDEAESKLRTLKNWTREFDSRVDPLIKQTEKLHTVLANDLVQAIAYLAEAINTLAAYSQLAPPVTPPSAAPAAASSEAA